MAALRRRSPLVRVEALGESVPRQDADFEISEVNPVAVFLQEDVALRPFAEIGNAFEFALRDGARNVADPRS